VTLILLLLLSLLLTLIIFLVAEIVVELTKLADFLPVIFDKVGQTFVQTFTKENTDFRRIIDTVQTYLEKNPEHEQRISQSIQENIGVIADKGSEFITGILVGIGQFISNLPYLITVLVFITLAALFIGWDWPRLRKKILWVIPVDIQKTIRSILTDLKKALLGFVRAQLALVTITAVIMLIGLTILKVPYAFTIAFIIGLVDLLPYLGVGAVLVPWIIYLFLTGNLQWAIGLSITYGIIITVRQFLEPKFVASSIGIDPLLTLISLFVGLKLFGMIGLILGPVTVVILMALHRARVFQDIWKYILGHEPPVLRHKKD
jgi:sporulation integral membrane protein YtvI